MGKFQSFYLRLLALLDVFRVVRKDLVFIRYLELIRWLYFDLLDFLVWVTHGSQPVQLDDFLRVILFISHEVPFFEDFFDDTGIEFTVS